ncbi:MAG: hypothetical protein J3Q66DRAFT_329855 [Benniella sp.]|nr:MAG: hypothetical protein J3Q66DRAFT_329855 [Benniella sp.]
MIRVKGNPLLDAICLFLGRVLQQTFTAVEKQRPDQDVPCHQNRIIHHIDRERVLSGWSLNGYDDACQGTPSVIPQWKPTWMEGQCDIDMAGTCLILKAVHYGGDTLLTSATNTLMMANHPFAPKRNVDL